MSHYSTQGCIYGIVYISLFQKFNNNLRISDGSKVEFFSCTNPHILGPMLKETKVSQINFIRFIQFLEQEITMEGNIETPMW